MDAQELAIEIVRRMLGVRDGEDLKDFFVCVKVDAHPGCRRSAIIRPWHMVKDAETVIELNQGEKSCR